MGSGDRESQESAAALASIGVSPQQELVWRALLQNPRSSYDDLASDSGLNHAQIAAAIDALSQAQLVVAASSDVGVVALDPSLAVESRIAQSERVLAEQQELLAGMRSLVPSLSGDYKRGRANAADRPGFELITGEELIRQQIARALERHTTDSRSIDMAPQAQAVRNALSFDLAALERGVRLRSIYGRAWLTDPEIYREVEFLHSKGEQVRTMTQVPGRLMVLDRDLAIVPAEPTDLRLGAIFIRVQSVIDSFIFMFEHLWDEATPAFSVSVATDAPTGRVAKILDLVVVGSTDQAMARTLGVGTRTVRREVSDIKARLGVSSRAEIAVAASRKGWL